MKAYDAIEYGENGELTFWSSSGQSVKSNKLSEFELIIEALNNQ